MRLLYILGLIFCCTAQVCAQDKAKLQEDYRIQARIAAEAPRVDGKLEDACWQNAPKAHNFWLKWPVAGEQAGTQTEVMLCYDARYLYVGAMCYDSTPDYVIQSLKRDASYWSSDGMAITLDPANRAQSGYFFGLTASGVQNEGLLDPTNDDVDLNWDNVWVGETEHLANGWSLEMAIPLRILRYKAGEGTWGINFIRNDPSRGQWSTWVNIPLQFDGINLGWMGAVEFEQAPQKAKGNGAFIPYLSAALNKDFEAGTNAQVKPGIGADGRIGIGSALNLDLTLLPDFSQVEIDEQVLNLTRFNIFLPEKRTFFLENADVFNRLGLPPIRPFFSRRIGLDADGGQIPILGGLRLTGNADPDTRIGVLDMQTRSKDGQTGDNFFAAAVHRTLFGRTTLSGYLTNRQGFRGAELSKGDYGRNAGTEFSWFSPNGAINAWATYHHHFATGEKNKRNAFYNTGFFYNSKRFSLLVDLLRMGENYRTDLGFETRVENYDAALDTVLRIGYNWLFAEGSVLFFPKNPKTSRLNLMALNFSSFTVVNFDGSLNEQQLTLNYEFNYKNTTSLEIEAQWNAYNLPVAFKFDDKPNEECPPLPKGAYTAAPALSLSWESDSRRRLGMEAKLTYGGFYNGLQTGATLLFKYRAQPWGNFGVQAQYNRLDFPMPYCDVVLLNITPRIELFFHRNLNWTTFIQYNNQANNFNINSRIQWRYRPMSDVFLVFTDNYRVQSWGARNRAVVLKAVYWM